MTNRIVIKYAKNTYVQNIIPDPKYWITQNVHKSHMAKKQQKTVKNSKNSKKQQKTRVFSCFLVFLHNRHGVHMGYMNMKTCYPAFNAHNVQKHVFLRIFMHFWHDFVYMYTSLFRSQSKKHTYVKTRKIAKNG